jgi:hypothetical protein
MLIARPPAALLSLLLGILAAPLLPTAAQTPTTHPATTTSAPATFVDRLQTRRIVYVVDATTRINPHFPAVQTELRRSIANLLPIQLAAVVAFGDQTIVFPEHGISRASTGWKKEVATAIDALQPAEKALDHPEDTLTSALQKALDMKPDMLYLLTTIAPTDAQIEQITARNNSQARICAILLLTKDQPAEDQLKKLAAANHGVYKFVSDSDVGR